ncbi:MAG TPA: HU family DNA-binding protein [Bacteroidales bacterium]|jgi:DNA-binding protein HU-beta|nr:HU family DNA-binding protein [Bacteroidales bacterium]HOF45814.1 HU family DNA-binding protein [Bacteroidales bacterium]HOS58154.1 HU family DNA-binding protein [Bacteroidales bacterium]HPY80437.1 HU family DNA-binding protein [Bacteroidales bacterium]HQA86496.1 HU family DNA-binding protein [Bacteroidales bacterium]
MNKAELVNAIAEKTGFTKVQAKNALEAVMEVTSDALKRGEKVSLIGFGTFAVTKRAARKGRNPQTKKEMLIPAKNVVKFKVSSELASQV